MWQAVSSFGRSHRTQPHLSFAPTTAGGPGLYEFDPEAAYARLTAVAAGEVDSFRNLEPESMLEETKQLQEVPWERKVTDGLGTRHPAVQHANEMTPETPVE